MNLIRIDMSMWKDPGEQRTSPLIGLQSMVRTNYPLAQFQGFSTLPLDRLTNGKQPWIADPLEGSNLPVDKAAPTDQRFRYWEVIEVSVD